VPAAPRQSPQPDDLALPDLDKGEDETEIDVGNFDLSLGDRDDAELPEDATKVDTFEIDIQVLTDSGSNEASSDLDIGEAGLIDELPPVPEDSEGDASPVEAEELDSHLDSPLEGDDPSSDAELGDDGLEALPELGTDEGDGDEGPDAERAFLPSAPEGNVPPGPAYDSEWLVLGDACSALAPAGQDVLCCGEHAMRFGAHRRSDALPPGTRGISIASAGKGALLASTRGLVLVQADGSAALLETPEPARGSSAQIVELAAAHGPFALWARLGNGVLLRQRAGAWERHQTGGEVRSLTSSAQRVTLLVMAQRPTLQVSADGGRSFQELILPEPARTVALGMSPYAVSGGAVVAVADAERGLCVSDDGGETFRMVTGAVNVTAIALGEHAGAPCVFAALYRESKDVSEIVLVLPATGQASRVAELAGEPDEDAEETGRTHALLFDDDSLWSAGGYGLARLRARR